MNRHSVIELTEQLLSFLQTDAKIMLPQSACETYADHARSLLEKASHPGEILYVGILGGTGVGKSTLINALAGKKISDPSDRRPFTDKAVVYRHRDTEVNFGNIRNFTRDLHALHDIDVIRDLILFDMPDFDSKQSNHLEAVMAILPKMDAIVWVVSPEKYADQALYDMVRNTEIYRENFTFVFNKSDELVRENGPEALGKLKEVLGDLVFRLKLEAGLEQPRVYSVSAAQEFEGSDPDPFLAREFQRFRDFLMARRNAKEIASVKSANLREQLRRLVSEISEDARSRVRIGLLQSLRITQLPAVLPEQSVSSLALADREKDLATAITGRLASSDRSIWPVRAVMKILSLARIPLPVASFRGIDEAFGAAAEVLTERMRSEFEKSAARINSELLLAFQTTEALHETGEPGLLIDREVRNASSRLSQNLRRVDNYRVPRARWLRLWQSFVLVLPVLFLIIKLSGVDRIAAWLSHPTVGGAIGLIVNFLTSLFGTDGLVGLSVLAICELVLLFVLSVRRTKKIEKIANGMAHIALESLGASLTALGKDIRATWERALDGIEEAFGRLNTIEANCSSVVPGKTD